jgi:3'(2'), 5'-bisphosphate nucleotidase
MLTGLQISSITELLEKAGNEILAIYYNEDFKTRLKEDNSPVTTADLASDNIIKEGLGAITPGINIFSEETKEISYAIRSEWDPLWILDPLDGTKEFIARNDEFCISLALVSEGKPFAGFIHSPVTRETWIASKGEGAFKLAEGKRVKLPFLTPSGPYRVNISRTHHSEKEAEWIEKLKEQHEAIISIHGSAVKFCKIAEGISDVYPKFGLIHEWDIAAGHLIIEEAGGVVIETATLKPPVYNKKEYFQPPFVAFGARVRNWEKYMWR